LVNDCGAKEGLEDNFIRIACRTEADNDRILESLMRLAKFTQSDEVGAVGAR